MGEPHLAVEAHCRKPTDALELRTLGEPHLAVEAHCREQTEAPPPCGGSALGPAVGDGGDIVAPSGVCGNCVAACCVFQRLLAATLAAAGALADGGEGGAALPEAMRGRLMAQAQTAAGARLESCSFLK